MDTTSPASSSTDGPDGTPAQVEPALSPAPSGPSAPDAAIPAADGAIPAAGGGTDHDASRRAFFRAFGRQAVTAAGQVAGMADLFGRGPAAAAANLLGLGIATPERRTTPTPLRPPTPSPASATTPSLSPADAYRSPYRLDGDVIRVLDQRALPDRFEELACRRASDVSYYLRAGAVRGGPIMAQLSAYALAMSAAAMADKPRDVRMDEQGRVGRSLVAARPSARLVAWVVAHMRARAEAVAADDGPRLAAALRAEADSIASAMQLGQAAIARALAELLPAPEDRPLSLLVHGAPGMLEGGLAGTALSAIAQLSGEGRDLLVRLTESRPFMDGARLAAWELRQAGVRHQVLPDAAVAWLVARERVDAILVAGEWIAVNGDVATLVGGLPLALASQAGGPGADGPVPIVVCALAATVDPDTPDGPAIPVEMRPGRELGTFATGIAADRLNALNPAVDVIPARWLGALVTDQGVLRPVTAEGVEGLVASGRLEAAAAAERWAAEEAAADLAARAARVDGGSEAAAEPAAPVPESGVDAPEREPRA